MLNLKHQVAMTIVERLRAVQQPVNLQLINDKYNIHGEKTMDKHMRDICKAYNINSEGLIWLQQLEAAEAKLADISKGCYVFIEKLPNAKSSCK